MPEKHNGNTFETFEASLVVLSISKVSFYKSASGGAMCLNKFCLDSINRLPPRNSINDCTNFEDNRSKQSGLRLHTSFKNGWRPSWKQDGGCKIIFFKSCPH